MKSSSSKGQGITILFFMISLVALVAGFTAYAQLQQLPPAFQDRVNELGIVTEAETRLEDTVNHFIPVAAHYGVAQASHYWGDEKNFIYPGHGDPDPRGPYSDDSDHDDDEMQYYTNLINNVDTQSQYFFESYSDTLNYDRCTVNTGDARVNLSFESQLINITADAGESLAEVNCNRRDIAIQASSAEGQQIRENMTNIRFHELAQGVIKAMSEMENVSEDLEANDRHWGSHTDNASCVYNEDGYTNPEEEAKDAAYQNTEDYIVNNIFEEIEAAIVKRRHGIGSGSNRGAKHVLWEYTHGGDLCIFGFCLAEPFMDDISYRNTEVIDNETTMVRSSSNSYRCGCNEWVCNQDPDSEYNYNTLSSVSGGSCLHVDESSVGSNSYSAHCSHEDGDASDGSCTQSDYSGSKPSPCPSGWSLNTTSDMCEDGGSTQSPSCTDSTDSDSDNDWDYSSSDDDCTWADGSFGSPYCDEEDFEHDGSGGCELAEEDLGSTDRPSPVCTDIVYNADTTVDYYYNSTLVQVEVYDDKYKIPTDDGWINLALHRRYKRNFWK